jgi:hypothetical protein
MSLRRSLPFFVVLAVLLPLGSACSPIVSGDQATVPAPFAWSTLPASFERYTGPAHATLRVFCAQMSSSRRYALITNVGAVDLIYTEQDLAAYDGSMQEVIATDLFCSLGTGNVALRCEDVASTYRFEENPGGLDLLDTGGTVNVDPYFSTDLSCFAVNSTAARLGSP